MGKKTTVLMILDGYGLNDKQEGNAVAEAKTPVMDALMKEYPFVRGNASGMAVGLPEGQMGNSEVGHLNMGAGRIVYQELTRITKEIEDGTFFENPALKKAMENCKANDTALHCMGLLSDGGVHSHNTHLYGLLEMAKRNGLEKVYVHCFLDGRDTPPASGKSYAAALAEEMEKIGVGKIASVMGRYYAMDRDNNYDRVKAAYDAMTKGEGETADCGICAIQHSYDDGVTDEFVKPTVVVEEGKPVGIVQDKDSVVFFNFRPDRAREITYSNHQNTVRFHIDADGKSHRRKRHIFNDVNIYLLKGNDTKKFQGHPVTAQRVRPHGNGTAQIDIDGIRRYIGFPLPICRNGCAVSTRILLYSDNFSLKGQPYVQYLFLSHLQFNIAGNFLVIIQETDAGKRKAGKNKGA